MIRGLYTGASAMLGLEAHLDAVSNNLANVSTNGYKKDKVVFRSFPEMLLHRVNDNIIDLPSGSADLRPYVGRLGTGVTVDEIYTDLSQGDLKQTDNPFDLALTGPGFFAVQTSQGIRYTRDGSFMINSQGELVDKIGNLVLDENNESIIIDVPDFIVQPDGTIVGGNNIAMRGDTDFIAKIQIADFENPAALEKRGYNYFADTIGQDALDAGNFQLHQGYLETANLNVVSEMVQMININRSYANNEKAIRAHDEALGKAVNNVGVI